MKYCSKCGKEVKENAKFCPKCGFSFEKKAQKKKEVKEKNKKGGKIALIIIAIVGGLIILGIALLFLISLFIPTTKTTTGKRTPTTIFNKNKVKIKKSEASEVTYEEYNNGLISIKIPKGWKVDIPAVDYIHYSFKLYNPKDPNYMLLFCLKQEGNLKTEKARSVYGKYYPNAPFAKLPAIDPQNAEGFYKVWNDQAKYVNDTELKTQYLPYLTDFNVVQNIGKTAIGGDILRATYKNSDGKSMQGLFTADVRSVGSYYINENIFNLMSEKVDVYPLNTYNIILMTAPDTEFTEWQPVLDKSLSTLKFSDKFFNGFNSEEKQITSTIKSNAQVYNQISDGIMDSWEKRNNSYDITSQKQSDATLGYERVYDTETGEIYKAYNGFTDDYKGERYKAIEDSQYTQAISGYIEK